MKFSMPLGASELKLVDLVRRVPQETNPSLLLLVDASLRLFLLALALIRRIQVEVKAILFTCPLLKQVIALVPGQNSLVPTTVRKMWMRTVLMKMMKTRPVVMKVFTTDTLPRKPNCSSFIALT